MKGHHEGVIVLPTDSNGPHKPKSTPKTRPSAVDKSDLQTHLSDFKTAAATNAEELSSVVDNSLSEKDPSLSAEESLDANDPELSLDPVQPTPRKTKTTKPTPPTKAPKATPPTKPTKPTAKKKR